MDLENVKKTCLNRRKVWWYPLHTSNSSKTVLQMASSFINFFVAFRSCFDFSFALMLFSSRGDNVSVCFFFTSSSSFVSRTGECGDDTSKLLGSLLVLFVGVECTTVDCFTGLWVILEVDSLCARLGVGIGLWEQKVRSCSLTEDG